MGLVAAVAHPQWAATALAPLLVLAAPVYHLQSPAHQPQGVVAVAARPSTVVLLDLAALAAEVQVEPAAAQ
jgi:hypothetical protein